MTAERKAELEAFWDAAFEVVGTVIANRDVFPSNDCLSSVLSPDKKLELEVIGVDSESFESAMETMERLGKEKPKDGE